LKERKGRGDESDRTLEEADERQEMPWKESRKHSSWLIVDLTCSIKAFFYHLLIIDISMMKLKVLTILIIVLLANAHKSGIRKLTEGNLEAFSKDNSYWLIQISGSASSS
jgi:hypothetical protein